MGFADMTTTVRLDEDKPKVEHLCLCGKTATTVIYVEIEPYEIWRCLEHSIQMVPALS